MKRIIFNIILLATIINASNISLDEEKMRKAYELGHFHGVTQVTREFDLELFNRFKGGLDFQQWIVAIKIDNLPIHQILLYKTYALSEGLAPVTTSNNLLVFASYKRETDANYLLNEVLRPGYFTKGGANEKVFVINNKAKHKYIYAPFIYNQLLESMETDVKSKVKTKVYILNSSPKKVIKKKVIKKKIKKKADKYFKVTNKISYYKYDADGKEFRRLLRGKKVFNENKFNEI